MYSFPPFMDKVLSEERQLMKWVENFRVGNTPGGSLMGWNFPRTNVYPIKFEKVCLTIYNVI